MFIRIGDVIVDESKIDCISIAEDKKGLDINHFGTDEYITARFDKDVDLEEQLSEIHLCLNMNLNKKEGDCKCQDC